MKYPIKLLHLFSLVLCLAVIVSCESSNSKDLQIQGGKWLFTLDLKEAKLPFEVEIKKDSGISLIITNAEEKIVLDDVEKRGDSLIAHFPVFESSMYLKIVSEDSLKGVWINYYKSDDYQIDLFAVKSERERFESEREATAQLFPKYQVSFSPGQEGYYPAIGLFKQKGNRVSGSFATETGDYRYLEGSVIGDSLFLSTFDGSHAFYFDGFIKDSLINGRFLSGFHFQEDWEAMVNPDFELRDPDSLTFSSDSILRPFSLENEEGVLVSSADEVYASKVKLIQIMGSWCPNCLDESLYFKELKEKYAEKGLEIIAIAFERTKGKEKAIQNIKRLKSSRSLNYPILLGGYTREQHPKDIFPMLNHIMSYPTTLYVDKNNRIRKIYTGFYGPGTGDLYEEYRIETENFLEKLLGEP